ncbi:MAG TPA: hypothetical protein VGJ14_19460 [Sporichthyaceae bacterium]|jgi:hypothetical protein
MGVVTGRTRRSWLLVAGGVASLCALPVLIGARSVHAPGIAAADLRTRILSSTSSYRGYAESDGTLGLPDLPEFGDVAGLFGGRTRLRIWHADPAHSRVDVLTPTGERGFYVNGRRATVWDYERNVVTALYGRPDIRLPRPADLNPPDLARRLLVGARPEELRPLAGRRVAGVAASGLRVVPADPDSTVGQIDVWADAATGVVLQVQVSGRSGPAALTTRFLDVTEGPHAVPDGVVSPPQPAGAQRAATRVPRVSPLIDRYAPAVLPPTLAGRDVSTLVPGGDAIRAYGDGFALFVAISLPADLADRAYEAAKAAGGQVRAIGVDSAVLLSTPLLTLSVVAPDGRDGGYVLAGTVGADVLNRAVTELVARR